MRKQRVFLGIVAVIVLALVAAPIVLAPGGSVAPFPAAADIDSAEQVRTIEALRKSERARPVIAILTLNEATEVTDFLVPYGVLQRANIADVTVVAERASPVPLHPFSRFGRGPELLSIEPQLTTRAFDALYPDGADYVVVPAMEPRDNPFVLDWIAAQSRKGASIVSVCAGALTLGAAGLLDGRRATTHWAYVADLQRTHPGMQWARDRRYVSDNGITTSTGITASMPTMIALIEAIAGRPKAEQIARDLGMANWDARHRSSAFQLTWEHQKTFLRNWLSFWRHESLGVPVNEGVDEIALGLTVDAWSRTALSKVVTVGSSSKPVRSRHGLMIHPHASGDAAIFDHMLSPPSSDAPARAIDTELAQIAARFDRPTADIVALVIEYPWIAEATR
ncbi:MAG TPA: DJ-1/PfpI family protein [Steroidobacteraceae bacterium]|nr:DJ-1/PfpI family protein [Steroidobacteraceae bacterium]